MATPEYKVKLIADALGFVSGTNKAKGALGGLGKELTSIKRLAAGALSFAGIGIGGAEIVRVADQYGQLTARLRLATQYSGDFAEVQDLLRKSAEDTRAPLTEAVDLYTKLSPALQGLGRNASESVGVITTVNQAIALSGASSQAAQAALMQFGQGLGSGALRGEELNSILEQTPALADAIAEGLGVTRGELRKLGSDGALSAERVVQALESVRDRVGTDFAALPLTVGQSLTLLQNAFTELVGKFDQGTGGTTALARGIEAVADGMDALGGSIEVIRPVIDFVVGAVDVISRLFKVVGTGLAGYTLAIKQALSGDLGGALATYKAIDEEVRRITSAPIARTEPAIAQAQDYGKARLKIERELADATEKLEALRAVAAGKANAEILLDAESSAKKRVDIEQKARKEELKGVESLRDALRGAWQESVEGARKAREEAAGLLRQASDSRQAGIDRAADRRMRGLSDEDRESTVTRSAQDARDQANSFAARATIKAYEGDLKAAEQLAAQAAKQAERAERFADQIGDDDTAAKLFEELGEIREAANRAQAKAKEREAKDLTEVAQQQEAQIQSADARIKALKAEIEKPITLQADIAQAEKSIQTLTDRLAAIKDKTVTVTVQTVSAGGASGSFDVAPEGSFALGGWTGPGSKFQPAGIVHAGEHVQPQEVVRERGALEFLERIRRQGFARTMNSLGLAGYASGGLVSRISAGGAVASRASAPAAAGGTPVVLDFGALGKYTTTAATDVAGEITRAFSRARLQRGGRG